MNNFETLNRLRLHSMLAEHGLGKPLNDYEMALQLVSTELRLARAEKALAIIEDAIAGHGIHIVPQDMEH